MSAELAPLKLERAEFSVDLKRDETIVSPSGSTAPSSSSAPIPARGPAR